MIQRIVFSTLFFIGCWGQMAAQTTANLRRFDDKSYPDYPMNEYRHEEFDSTSYDRIEFRPCEKAGHFDITVFPTLKKKLDTVVIKNVNLLEFMPSAPAWTQGDPLLTQIALQNQEWNRQQVMFMQGKFEATQRGKFPIRRIDLVNNCLGAGAWEIQIYGETTARTTRIYYHGWFSFPKALYEQLFDLRHQNTAISYKSHGNLLDSWVNLPTSKAVSLQKLRTVLEDKNVKIEDKNDDFYLIKSNEERKFKFKNIISPQNPTKIRDFLNNSTTFASFDSPGIYVKAKPRPTELARINKALTAVVRTVKPANGNAAEHLEIEITLTDVTEKERLKMVIGGLNFFEIPRLPDESKGVATTIPFGISNHALTTLADFQQYNSSLQMPNYAFLLTEDGHYIDHHAVGVDAPVVYMDRLEAKLLHVWLLSYERHCWVGHYTVDLSEVVKAKITTGLSNQLNLGKQRAPTDKN